MEILYLGEIALVKLHVEVRSGRWTLWSGLYMKNSKGYWYKVLEEWGQLTRIKYAKPEQMLDELLSETIIEEQKYIENK